MADVIKTQYMDRATRGYNEYVVRNVEALNTFIPVSGDRAILLDGSLYFCLEPGKWELIGG